MDWEVYNITPDDKQLIDLTVIVGRPFPSIQSYEDDDDDVIDDDVMNESRDLVKVMIKAHEGVVSSYPITIKPYQTVSDVCYFSNQPMGWMVTGDQRIF